MKDIRSFLTVDWSHPSSPNADRLRCKAGCWTISRVTYFKDQRGVDRARTEFVAGPFLDEDSAREEAALIAPQ